LFYWVCGIYNEVHSSKEKKRSCGEHNNDNNSN